MPQVFGGQEPLWFQYETCALSIYEGRYCNHMFLAGLKNCRYVADIATLTIFVVFFDELVALKLSFVESVGDSSSRMPSTGDISRRRANFKF